MSTFAIDLSDEIFSTDPLWPSKNEDVVEAVKILEDNTIAGQLRFIDSFEEKGDSLTIVLPEWMMALIKYFSPLYSEQTPDLVNQLVKVLFNQIFGLDYAQTRAEQLFLRRR